METVNRRALQYYDRQSTGNLSSDSLERRARLLQAMGEDYIQAADLASAIAAFRQAHRITEEQLVREPNSPQRIFAHGQSEYWVGRVYELRRDWPNAGRQYALYRAAAQRLIAIEPNNPDYMLEMAWGESNRGVVQRDGQQDYLAAEASFMAAVRWFERAIASRPRDGDRRDLANAYANLADTFYMRQLWRASLAVRQRQLEINQSLMRRNPGDVEGSYRLANVERAVARLHSRLGDRAAVLPPLLAAYARAEALTARDPSNAAWLRLKTNIECDLLSQSRASERGIADARLRQGIVRAAAIFEQLHQPARPEFQLCIERARSQAPEGGRHG
jgi:tetratricopeptide (TPR) repeat protein